MKDDLLAFIIEAIPSVWSLELLLVLHRAADRNWRVVDLVRETRGSSSSVKDGLSALVKAGLAVYSPGGEIRYQPTTAEKASLADELVQAYAETPIAVVKAILSSPSERIRTFSNAFILKRRD